MNRKCVALFAVVPLLLSFGGSARAAVEDSAWPTWRGPDNHGTSPATGLISSWSKEGEGLLWRDDWTGRSTPVVVDGRVCANGRRGAGVDRQEAVACWDAASGEKLWEKRFNVYHTTVPWSRVGWAHITADPETGYLYAQGVGGLFQCLDSRDGRTVWSKSFLEEYGFMEGYGGRTQTAVIDEDRVVISFSNTSWGKLARPLHRYFALDKRTGELIWVSSPAPSQADKNTQSTPAVAVIGGRRLLIAGNGGGGIYAIEARTGKPVWGFQLSKRGINTSVVVDGETVYVAHSEENVDKPEMGRVVAIDATGSGDVTQTHERWRSPVSSGFSTPALYKGRLYVVDNSANLHVLNAATGEQIGEEFSLGTVGKASPVVADGKIYATEVNGKFHILQIGEAGLSLLDSEQLTMPEGRHAEIYSSPAIAYGRIYFTTEEGIYCLGKKEPAERSPASAKQALEEPPVASDATVATLVVRPAEVLLRPGENAEFSVESFDAMGRSLGARPVTSWAKAGGLAGSVTAGRLTVSKEVAFQTGMIEAKVGEVSGQARVRVVSDPPYSDDFESYEAGKRPPYFLGYISRFSVADLDGNKVIVKGPSPVKIHRHHTLIGKPSDAGYTIQADLMGVRTGRKVPDMGLINSGYTLDMMAAYQQVQIRSWAAELRMADQVPLAWLPDTWYTVKLRVDADQDGALVRGKVWPKGEPEPAAWTITVRDPHPIASGSPGLYGYSPSPIYYDNLKVTPNR